METGKSSDSMPRCSEIAIPIEENGQGLDHMIIQDGDSKHLTASEFGSYSFSNTSLEKASDDSSAHSESLRRSPSNTTKIGSTTASELLIRRPSSRKSMFSNKQSTMLEVETESSSNLARNSSGLGTKGSFSRISFRSRAETLRAGTLPPAGEHDEDDNNTEDEIEDEDADDNNDDDNVKKNDVKPPKRNLWKRCKNKFTLKAIDIIIEWILFLGAMAVLIASLYAHKLRIHVIWGLEIWKWCVLVAVFFCGRLVTKWARDCLVFLIESKYLFNEKVVYFVHGVKQSVRVVIWLSLVLLAWFLLIDHGDKRSRSRKTIRVIKYITRALGATLIGAVLWMVKTLLVKLIAASFHVKTFFSKIREAIFNEYVLWALSLPETNILPESGGNAGLSPCSCFKTLKWKGHKRHKGHEEITIKRLGRMRSGKMPVSTMGRLVDRVRSSKLSIISSALDDRLDDKVKKEITTKSEAEEAASQIFQNVKSPDHDYIEEGDLSPFKNKENGDYLLEWFKKLAVEKKITKSELTNWAVNVFKERDDLSHSLKDAKTAIEELNRILSGIVLVLIIIVWLLLMGLATTKLLFILSSQLLVAVFIFGNTCRTVFEAMIFVFVMHPFDVGDRCVIDGVMMVVEEMDILKTTFLRYDNQKIYYPNAVLASKAIGNFNRSPEMGDSVNFDVDVSTPPEIIEALGLKIKEHLEKTPEHWHPDHSVQINEIENMNKMKMSLFVNHKMNFQEYREKMNRRTKLMLALKKIFEDLKIKYHLLPQEVQVTYNGSAAPTTSMPAMQPRSVF